MDAKNYNRTNGMQVEAGKQLIDQITHDFENR